MSDTQLGTKRERPAPPQRNEMGRLPAMGALDWEGWHRKLPNTVVERAGFIDSYCSHQPNSQQCKMMLEAEVAYFPTGWILMGFDQLSMDEADAVGFLLDVLRYIAGSGEGTQKRCDEMLGNVCGLLAKVSEPGLAAMLLDAICEDYLDLRCDNRAPVAALVPALEAVEG